MSANEIPTSPTITRHYRVRFTIFPPPPTSALPPARPRRHTRPPLSAPFQPLRAALRRSQSSLASRVTRSSALGSYYHGIVSVPSPYPSLPLPETAVPSFPLLPSLYCSPPLLLLLLLLGPSSETTVVQRERRIRPKCIGSCGRVLFPFNRANAFRITFRETAGRSASPRGRFPAPGDNRV